MRLLLAEDEKEMAHALEAVFTHNHYSVDVVYNGIDAADWWEPLMESITGRQNRKRMSC